MLFCYFNLMSAVAAPAESYRRRAPVFEVIGKKFGVCFADEYIIANQIILNGKGKYAIIIIKAVKL